MPVGLDDVVLLVASATPLLWAKRGDWAPAVASSSITRKSESETIETCQTAPCVLLPGLNLPDSPVGEKKAPECTLISSSIAERYTGEVSWEYPLVPHRHFYRGKQKRPPVTDLVNLTVDEVSVSLSRYSVPEVSHLYEVMEQENNWEAALMVTAGARKGNHFAYLVRQNLEKAVRTLLIAGRHGLVADFCLAYTSEVLLSDDVLVAVFDTCRRSEKKSMALYESLRPFLAQWTPAVYACCLTVTAQFKWQEALLIYHDYVNRRLQLGQTLIARLLSQVVRPIGGLREEGSGPAASSPNHTLQFLYHIMVPLVAERQPEHLEQIYRHMMVHEPEAAADVMLRCLQNERGRALATHWLRESSQSSVGCGTVSMDVFSLASALYSKKPNVMNLNSLIRVMAATESSLHCPSDAERLQQYVREVPMADTDAYVLARTVTDEHGHWKLATQLMTAMIARRQFHVVPSLSAHVARQGRWALAAKAMAVCLSNRGSFSPAEFQLCVHSSVLSGRWRSAFFWMERAHAAGVRLSSDTYDGAYGVARHCSWLESLRAVVSMHAAGGASSSGGILNVLEAAGEQGKVDKALRVICGSGGVFWTL